MVDLNIKKIIKGLSSLSGEPLTGSGKQTVLQMKKYAEEILAKNNLSIKAKSMDGKQSFTIDVCDPYLVSTDGRNIILHIEGKDRLLLSKISLKSLEEKWKGYFTRISRTSLVANNAIRSVQRIGNRYTLELGLFSQKGEGRELEISRRSFYLIRNIL